MFALQLQHLLKAKNQNRFIALRYSGKWIGINCSIPAMVRPQDYDMPSLFEAWKPITFMEYISCKVPFVTPKRSTDLITHNL